MDHNGMRGDVLICVRLARDRGKWPAFVNTVMNCLLTKSVIDF